MVEATCIVDKNMVTYKIEVLDTKYLIHINSKTNQVIDIVKLFDSRPINILLDNYHMTDNIHHFVNNNNNYIVVLKDVEIDNIHGMHIFKLDNGKVNKLQTVNSLVKILSFWVERKKDKIQLKIDTQHYTKTIFSMINEIITYVWDNEKFTIHSIDKESCRCIK